MYQVPSGSSQASEPEAAPLCLCDVSSARDRLPCSYPTPPVSLPCCHHAHMEKKSVRFQKGPSVGTRTDPAGAAPGLTLLGCCQGGSGMCLPRALASPRMTAPTPTSWGLGKLGGSNTQLACLPWDCLCRTHTVWTHGVRTAGTAQPVCSQGPLGTARHS